MLVAKGRVCGHDAGSGHTEVTRTSAIILRFSFEDPPESEVTQSGAPHFSSEYIDPLSMFRPIE